MRTKQYSNHPDISDFVDRPIRRQAKKSTIEKKRGTTDASIVVVNVCQTVNNEQARTAITTGEPVRNGKGVCGTCRKCEFVIVAVAFIVCTLFAHTICTKLVDHPELIKLIGTIIDKAIK